MRIKLNKKFYNKEAIEEALHEFNEVCKGNVLNDEIEIELEPKENVNLLEEEFCNYVLGLMKNKMLV
jgi:hypothetical protein